MQVALICPPALLKKYGQRTQYHLVLPHLSQEKRYRDFYLERSRSGDYIILDNGAAEGLEFGTKHLYTVAEKLGAHEIVVPDVLGDMNGTLARALAFTRYTREGYRYMAVAQGNTIDEVMKSIDFYATDLKMLYIHAVGIPRLINKVNPNARGLIAQLIKKRGYDVSLEFHYLGASDPFDEVIKLAETGIGRGIDTSGPIYMARWGMELRENHPYRARPKDFFKINRINAGTAEQNIQTYLRWAKYNPDAPLPERAEYIPS